MSHASTDITCYLGPFKITVKQIIISIEASLIVIPVNVLLVQVRVFLTGFLCFLQYLIDWKLLPRFFVWITVLWSLLTKYNTKHCFQFVFKCLLVASFVVTSVFKLVTAMEKLKWALRMVLINNSCSHLFNCLIEKEFFCKLFF